VKSCLFHDMDFDRAIVSSGAGEEPEVFFFGAFFGWKEIPLCSDVCLAFGSFAYVASFLVSNDEISDGRICGRGRI